MTGCRTAECRNDAYRRRLCRAHWELDMAARKKARQERDKAWRRAQPIDLAAWCERQRSIVNHMVEKVERDSADLAAFAELARLVKDMDAALGVMARHLHDQQGYSWTDFGNALGVSRQAARQRFGTQAEAAPKPAGALAANLRDSD